VPLIVDVGGRPTAWQEAIFDYCTHAVLLTPDESAQAVWLDLASRHNLILMADLRSELHGTSQVTATQPVLKGVIAGLEWGERIGGPTFEVLVDRVTRLFAYDPDRLRRSHLASAPVETAIDLDRLAHTLEVPFTGDKAFWEPHHLAALLDYLPKATPLGLYGRGPNWLYAALALHAHPAPFYQFDVRLGWVIPPTLQLGLPTADAPLQAHQQPRADHTRLAFAIPRAYLDYSQAEGLTVPSVALDQGLVLSGKLPLWLWTALALAYRDAPWLAVYQPQWGDQAMVISSHTPEWPPGHLLVSHPSSPEKA
jgi:CRISPR-associated protein Csx3